MLAQRMRGLLPPLDFDEALEVTRVHGAAGLIREGVPIAVERPFRAPHHTASTAGLLGGGSPPRPGEISLAHRGVLFLDELPEFDRRSLEALRQVLEQRHVVVSRARGACVFPADFVARRRRQPLPLRLAAQRPARLPLRRRRDRALPRAPLGPAARPHRPARERAGRALERARLREPGAEHAIGARARDRGARARQQRAAPRPASA